MRVIIACEYSGTVRDAFIARGHHAVSCDLLPTEKPGPHILDDIRTVDLREYDLMIAHPPCTHLAVSGAAWFARKAVEQADALDFVRWLMAAPVPRIAIENPVSVISSRIRKPDQIIHPYHFSHPEQKTTCLWLKNLPRLLPTADVYGQMMQLPKRERERLHYLSPSADRWKLRSATYSGIAAAMADQWGSPRQSQPNLFDLMADFV